MNLEKFREYCLSLPHVTEEVLWQKTSSSKSAARCSPPSASTPAPRAQFSFKCTPDEFAELTEIEGTVPAPYAARYHWVTMEKSGALKQAEIRRLIKDAYVMVKEKLPKKTQARLC